jgi:hypothetical protein
VKKEQIGRESLRRLKPTADCNAGNRKKKGFISYLYKFNPFQSNFSANRMLPRSYLLWAGKRLVDYLFAKVRTT